MSRMPRRRNASASRQAVATEVKGNPETSEGSIASRDNTRLSVGKGKYDGLQQLWIDKLLATSDEAAALGTQTPNLQDLGVLGRC
jgi:hypothetical protein